MLRAIVLSALVAGFIFPRFATAVTCENEVQDHPQLLGVSSDSSMFAMRALRAAEGEDQTFGVVLYLCKTGGTCERFEVAKPTDGTEASPTPKAEREAILAKAKADIAVAKIELGKPMDAFTENSDKPLLVPEQAARQAGLGSKASFEFSDKGDLLLRFGKDSVAALQPAQTALSEMGPYSVSGWALFSKDGQVVVHGGYDDKLCRRGLLISSTRLGGLVAMAENHLGLAAFQKGNGKEAQDHFERATKQAPNYRPAWVNRVLAALVAGNGKDAVEALAKLRQLDDLNGNEQSATLCAWPRIPAPDELMDEGYASCPDTFSDDEFHRVGSSKDGQYVAIRRVIRKVTDEEEHQRYPPVLGGPNFGTELYLCEVGQACGKPFVVSSPWGTSKADGKAALRKAKDAFSGKGVVLSEPALVFRPLAGVQIDLLAGAGIAGPVTLKSSKSAAILTASVAGFPDTTVAEFFGPIEPLKVESGDILLVHRDPCDGLAALKVVDPHRIAALLYHAKGIEELNKREYASAAATLSNSVQLWPEFTQVSFDLALARLLSNDVAGAAKAVKGLAAKPELKRIARPTANLCR